MLLQVASTTESEGPASGRAVDLTALPQAGVGDEVLLLGARDGVEIRPEQVAELAGTIPYELMVKIDSRRVQRVFVGD